MSESAALRGVSWQGTPPQWRRRDLLSRARWRRCSGGFATRTVDRIVTRANEMMPDGVEWSSSDDRIYIGADVSVADFDFVSVAQKAYDEVMGTEPQITTAYIEVADPRGTSRRFLERQGGISQGPGVWRVPIPADELSRSVLHKDIAERALSYLPVQ